VLAEDRLEEATAAQDLDEDEIVRGGEIVDVVKTYLALLSRAQY